jgi:hypothetical protein
MACEAAHLSGCSVRAVPSRLHLGFGAGAFRTWEETHRYLSMQIVAAFAEGFCPLLDIFGVVAFGDG